MIPELSHYLSRRAAEVGTIDADRRAALAGVADFIRAFRDSGSLPRLIFICTHNSRRSQMAELWAAAAAAELEIKLETFSGGTEATAFNPSAVDAMRRAGFRIEPTGAGDNPLYHAYIDDEQPPIRCFSKKYDDTPNPLRDFVAIMVCDHADAGCPIVRGAAARFSIPYVDPKEADDTPRAAEVYDERCAQIAREMRYMLARVAE